MEGYFLFVVVALLLAGTSAHDVDDRQNSSGSFVIPPESFNLTSPPTTLDAGNESVTTVLFLNQTTTRNLSESETTMGIMQELRDNFTTEATKLSSDTTPHSEDLTVTDSSGCLTVLKEKIEENCHDKFEQTIVSLGVEEEAYNSKACCALEDYEKCAQNGYKRSNCQLDQKELKNLMGTARIFIAAMTKVNCAEHKAECNSASVIYPFNLVLAALPVLFLFL